MSRVTAQEYTSAVDELDEIYDNLPSFTLYVEDMDELSELTSHLRELQIWLASRPDAGFELHKPIKNGEIVLISPPTKLRISELEKVIDEWEKSLEDDSVMMS